MDLVVHVNRVENNFVHLSMYLNGCKISSNCGMAVRVSEIAAFFNKINPDKIVVDREMIDDHFFHRISGFKAVQFI